MTLEFEARAQVGPFAYEAAFTARDEVVVLFGHSGAGKSITLQFIAGLMQPAAGRIVIGDEVVFDADRRINLRPQERNTGYVVQELALFPQMTAAQNVSFGVPRGIDRDRRVRQLMSALTISEFADRKPATLSGGQRQRVALARALARDSRLLLLDEPFSALDESLRITLRRELLRLRSVLGLTIIFVTHDLREAHLLADRIAVFDDGRLLQFDMREAIFRRPVSRRVAQLTGVTNVCDGIVRRVGGDYVDVEVDGLALRCGVSGAAVTPGDAVDVAIRSERVVLRRGESGGANSFAAGLTEQFAYGSTHTLRLDPIGPGPALEVELAARPYEVLGVAHRTQWTVELPPEDLHIMTKS